MRYTIDEMREMAHDYALEHGVEVQSRAKGEELQEILCDFIDYIERVESESM